MHHELRPVVLEEGIWTVRETLRGSKPARTATGDLPAALPAQPGS